MTEDLSPKGWNTDLVEAGDAAADMSRRSVVKSLDSGKLEKNHRIVTTFWALKCRPGPLLAESHGTKANHDLETGAKMQCSGEARPQVMACLSGKKMEKPYQP